VIRYGHRGRPALVFPSDQGKASDFEQNGMVDAIAALIYGGRLQVYCIDSYDAWCWSDSSLPAGQRARVQGDYEGWITGQLVPWIHRDCGGRSDIATVGCSLGALHAANFALKRADLFPLALCFSGNYDRLNYVARLDSSDLLWLRRRVRLLLVCGQGTWEDTTGSLDSTKRFAALLAAKNIHCELDLWSQGFPHDWPSWQAQFAYHMPRFC
jgi:esterase/lipase superfamily enzyme